MRERENKDSCIAYKEGKPPFETIYRVLRRSDEKPLLATVDQEEAKRFIQTHPGHIVEIFEAGEYEDEYTKGPILVTFHTMIGKTQKA